VLVSDFFFQEIGDLLPSFSLLPRCEIDHHAVGLHHTIDGGLHLCGSLFPEQELPIVGGSSGGEAQGPTAAIGDENADRAPAILAEWSSDMQRRRFKHVVSFPDDLSEEAKRLRAEAEKLPPGTERHGLERKARQAETAAHIDEWLESSGLRPPE
jgi:hypothetical protein